MHFWPFDGWDISDSKSVVAEAYPALWSKGFVQSERNSHQHDAYSIAAWLRNTDASGSLGGFFNPPLDQQDRAAASIEGWILGVSG